MPFNSAGSSFEAISNLATTYNPSLLEGAGYNGLTTAQCNANGSFTSKSVTNAGILIDAAKVRTTGITLIVPTDQPAVTFGNQSPLSGNTSPNPIAPYPVVPANGSQNTNSSTPSNGFTLQPGQSIFLSPYFDAMYAITPAGVSATVFFFDS